MTDTETTLTLPELELPVESRTRWFAGYACVVLRDDGVREVRVGGTLVGSFGPRETGQRNLLLVTLAESEDAHLEHLSAAFGVTSQTLRNLRKLYAKEGAKAIWERRWGGNDGKVSEKLRARLEKMFDEGATVAQALTKVGRRAKLSLRTMQRVRATWEAKRSASTLAAEEAPAPQLPLGEALTRVEDDDAVHVDVGAASAQASPTVGRGSKDEGWCDDREIVPAAVESADLMQHAGTWVLISLLHEMGLYDRAERIAEDRVDVGALRIAIDAVVMALAIGQRCVEGVRRLATPSAPKLLRASRAPSASWARRTLGLFCKDLGGARLLLGMAGGYVREAAEQAGGAPVVFYVDNHVRPYTGKHVLRKGWRMQDKHVVPGTSDYYVHDIDGRPVLRVTAPHHGSLTEFLSPVARILREALGPDERILLAFDRAGSFPEAMADLREQGFEFVTYERRPYALLAETEFGKPLLLDDERVRIAEGSQKNLRGGRGRVRRIAVRREDGSQINLLAISEQSAEWLLRVMTGRWNQENAFKHGTERWGINQLDSRSLRTYSPDTIIPNPARRRLEQARRIARAREGQARLELARLTETDPRRAKWEHEITEAMQEQADLEALRPSTPAKAQLKDTDLAERLVHHADEYKVTIDTLRIACANAEADLAAVLGRLLPRSAEAKKALGNLFAAPARIRVTDDAVTVTLLPAGTESELEAFKALCVDLRRRRLTLPGDARRRPVAFQTKS